MAERYKAFYCKKCKITYGKIVSKKEKGCILCGKEVKEVKDKYAKSVGKKVEKRSIG
jgi:protein-arginine kinase activator protein McsA